jgi:hypothetical protein
VTGWIPKDAPGQDARSPSELTTAELNACLEYAEDKIAATGPASKERRDLQEWMRGLLAEKDQRATIAAEAVKRAKATNGCR